MPMQPFGRRLLHASRVREQELTAARQLYPEPRNVTTDKNGAAQSELPAPRPTEVTRERNEE